jgi:hypothetical protein
VRAAVDGWGVALLRPGSGGTMRRAWLRPNEESGTAQTRARASSQAAEMGSVGGAYISADELLSHPSLAGSPGGRGRAASAPQLSRHSLRYDMDAHYRFGGAIPRAPKQQWPPVYRELLVFTGRQGTPGVMPSAPKLKAAGRNDLALAIGRAGGWHKVAGDLGLQMAQTLREVYFTCPHHLREGQEIEFTLPGMPQRFAATIPKGVSPGDEFVVSRAFSSCTRSILTEIYLCHACSCQEIEE